MKKDFSKNIIFGFGCAYLALAPSEIISKQMDSFVARINGPGKYSQQSNSHLAYITLSGQDILEIKELKSSELKNKKYRSIIRKDDRGFIETFYPSDYRFVFSSAEQLSANNYKRDRENLWSQYVTKGQSSLVVAVDKNINNLSKVKKAKELKRRQKIWNDISKMYLLGDYYGVIEKARVLYPYPSHQAMAHFITGSSAKKFQDYELAIKHFKKSIDLNVKTDQVYYELGQSQFALNNLDNASRNFKESHKRGHKPARSQFYLGWIKEAEKKPKEAKSIYKRIIADKTISDETKQSVLIRIAKITEKEIDRSPASSKAEKVKLATKQLAVPLRKALQENKNTKNASTIERYLERINNKYNIPSIIPFKLGSMGDYLRFNQNFQYNSNASNEAESLSSFRDSYVSKSQLVYKHLLGSKKGFIHTPELRLNYDYYAEQNVPNIALNDQYMIAPSLRNSFEHEWFGKKSAFIFDIETSYTARNLASDGTMKFFSRGLKLNIGDSYNFSKFGRTNFKFRRDYRTFFDSSLNSSTNTIFINQFFKLKDNKTISLIANADFTSVKDSTNDANSYMLRADYIAPKSFYKGDIQAGLTFLATDTLEQSATRGTEISLSPEIEWRRTFSKNFEIALQYYYTNNTSKSDALEFDQHILSFEIELNKN